MSLQALMEQLQKNTAETYNRRRESEQAMASLAGQAATMVPSRGGRASRGGGRASGPVLKGGEFKGGEMPAPGSASQHGGYSWAKWAGDINVSGPGDLGNAVRAWRRGRVVDVVNRTDSYGKHIRVRHPNGTETLYAHLSGMRVKPGQIVKRGQMIGRVGSTGNSSGPHLHFEIK